MGNLLLDANFEKCIRQSIPHQIVQPRRAQVYVGFRCHQKCGFCYYKNQCQNSMFPLEFIKKQIDFLLKYGIRDFEITGGEPSELSCLPDVCRYIKSQCPKSKIAVITNGGLWKSKCWDFVDEILLSYHLGKDTAEYDKKMFPLGNTFEKAKKTADLARDLGKVLRTNTVLGTFNLDGIDDVLKDIVSFNPSIMNFLPVNLFDEAGSMASFINYNKLRPILKKAINFIARSLPNTLVFARYMPFCQMEGYENHILGHLQHIYDWFDWNVELSGIEYLKDIQLDGGASLLKRLGRYGSTSVKSALDTRKQLYQKFPECLTCKYNLICDGIELGIPRDLASTFVSKSSGPMIKNPLEYIGEISFARYQAIYGNDVSLSI